MTHILNFKESPLDTRDYIFKTEFIHNNELKYPETLDLRDDLMPVRNQGSQGTFYAQSVACMKEWQERKNYNFSEYFSPQFFYNLRSNKYDEDPENDSGMYGRDVMRLLKKHGICPEKIYPYGKIQHRDDIPPEVYGEAVLNIIDSYARINNIEDLKMSLFLNGPAIIGFPVYNYTGQMWKQKDNESFKGGHAMTIVGYNEYGFIIRNSWGDNWNEDGYTIYHYKDWGAHWEIWACVDKKDIVPPKPIIPDSPKPSDSEEETEDEKDEYDSDDNESNNDINDNETFCSKLFKLIFN